MVQNIYQLTGTKFWEAVLNDIKRLLIAANSQNFRELSNILGELCPKDTYQIGYFVERLKFLYKLMGTGLKDKNMNNMYDFIEGIIKTNPDQIDAVYQSIKKYYDLYGYDTIWKVIDTLYNACVKEDGFDGNKGDILRKIEELKFDATIQEKLKSIIINGTDDELKKYFADLLMSDISNDQINDLRHLIKNFKSSISLPKIETLNDAMLDKEVANYVGHHREDHIYFIKGVNLWGSGIATYSRVGAEIDTKFYIAGSSVLEKVSEIFASNSVLHSKVFESNDTDLFIVNNNVKFRAQFGKTDIVYTRDKSIEELLLNFDLPCCRIATNPKGDIWISIQCINALKTGAYMLPEYLKNKEQFINLIMKYPGEELKKCGKNSIMEHADYLYDRLQGRIQKYQARGFNPVYYHTTDILPWIINRIDYTEPTKLFD